MSSNNVPAKNDAKDDGKSLADITIQNVAQNLSTIQTVQSFQGVVQTVTNVIPTSSVQSVQTTPVISGTNTTSIVGKSVALELNSNAKILMKAPIPSNLISTLDGNTKITPAQIQPIGPSGQTVRLITPGIINAGERAGNQTQQQQNIQHATQIVTSSPSTSLPIYHVPRGPAAVASISTPRSAAIATVKIGSSGEPLLLKTVAGRITTANANQIPGARMVQGNIITTAAAARMVQGNIITTASQWRQKTPSVVYAPRGPLQVVSRASTRPPTPVYSEQPQATVQISTSTQSACRPTMQRVVATGHPVAINVQNPNSTNNSVPRMPVTNATTAPPLVQVSAALVTQAARPQGPLAQVAQTLVTGRTLPNIGSVSRIAVPTTLATIRAPSRIPSGTTVQTISGKKLTMVGATPVTTTGAAPNRIVMPQHCIQPLPQQQQNQQQSITPVLQTVTPITNLTISQEVSRVISSASSNNQSNVKRIDLPVSVTRVANTSIHPLPLTPARPPPGQIKVAQAQTIQTSVQMKQPVQQQPQLPHSQPLQQSQIPTLPNTEISINNNNNNNNTSNIIPSNAATQAQGQNQGPFLHTYFSVDQSGNYSQYRQTSGQPVRLLLEQGYEEPQLKPNSSPRPSILRKRDHDTSPAKAIAKNLAPVLAALQNASSSNSSPPGSPKFDNRDGNQSSGSTTVSATSSPGLDEEPDNSRIIINQSIEMSPRKKPRKQQLTSVESNESRCKEEMQFITEEKIKKEIKEEPKEKYGDGRSNIRHHQDAKHTTIKKKPAPSLLATSWKCKWTGRQNHYRRPSDVRPREERRPTVNEIAQQKQVLQKVNGWKVYHLTAQMQDLAELEKQVHDKLKTTVSVLETQQNRLSKPDEGLEKVSELMKGNMQRSILISEGMNEARTQLVAIFQHKSHVTEILQRCASSANNNNSNKRTQKKREK